MQSQRQHPGKSNKARQKETETINRTKQRQTKETSETDPKKTSAKADRKESRAKKETGKKRPATEKSLSKKAEDSAAAKRAGKKVADATAVAERADEKVASIAAKKGANEKLHVKKAKADVVQSPKVSKAAAQQSALPKRRTRTAPESMLPAESEHTGSEPIEPRRKEGEQILTDELQWSEKTEEHEGEATKLHGETELIEDDIPLPDETELTETELTETELEEIPDLSEETAEDLSATESSDIETEETSEGEVPWPKEELEPKDEKPSSREEDYALIDIIREGNRYQQQQAFKKLLSKYRGQIYNLILKIVHNPNEVEDLVQETFSKAFNSITNFNKEYAFSTWLYRIATNSSIDFLRKRRLKTFSIDNPIKTKDDEYTVEIPDSTEEPEKNVMQKQRDALVREAIEQLPGKYRTVIEMRHLQELTYEEIAKALKIPLGTVKAHIFRAREMLYKMLRDKLRSY